MEQPLIVDDEMSQLPIPNQQALHVSDPLKSRKKTFYRMGITEIVFGCLSILLAIVAIAINKEEAIKYSSVNYYGDVNAFMMAFTYMSQGIWGGIVILITGILAVRTKNSTNRCLYIANMVMAIIASTIVEATVCILSFNAAAISLVYSTPLSVLHFIIFAINFAGGILSIFHASFCCCCGLCCTQASVTSPKWQIYRPDGNNVVSQQPFYVQVPTGQLVMVAKSGSVMNQEFMDRSQPVVVHLSEEARFVAEPCRSFYPTRTQGQQNNISSFFNSPISPIQT